jgi:cobalt-zinc-cadmium efflux system protein
MGREGHRVTERQRTRSSPADHPLAEAHGHDHGHSHDRGDHAHAPAIRDHSHSHSHGHAHGHIGRDGAGRGLSIVLGLTATFMVVEAVAGWLTNSLTLLSDAGHMLTDVGAIALALFALWFSRQRSPSGLSFGYLRSEILAALINGVALLGITFFIFREAWERLQQPEPVQSGPMLVVAILGLLVNFASLWVLSRGGGNSLNERGVWLHVMGDALGSVGAIGAAIVIRVWGWVQADPIISAVIGLLILRSTWSLLREAVNVLMEGTPVHLSWDEVRQAMRDVPGVADVKDLHLWSLASGYEALSAHVVVPEVERSDEIRFQLRCLLRERYQIDHTTLEIQRPGDTPDCPPGQEGRCPTLQRAAPRR